MDLRKKLLEIPGIKISVLFSNPVRSGNYEVVNSQGDRFFADYDKTSSTWRFDDGIAYWVAPSLKRDTERLRGKNVIIIHEPLKGWYSM